MKRHNCFDHLSYPHHDPPKPVIIPEQGYEEKWQSVCGVCGRRYLVTREITYRLYPLPGGVSEG
ncbi:MAG: hypothetical protein HPY50_18280 [Firmicutes bacterium]|nr:hypothetical protein [Bacillota bacterium]